MTNLISLGSGTPQPPSRTPLRGLGGEDPPPTLPILRASGATMRSAALRASGTTSRERGNDFR